MLKRGVEGLTLEREMDSLIETFLAESVRVMAADAGAVTLKVAGTVSTYTIAAVFENGVHLSPEIIAADPYLSRFPSFSQADPGSLFQRMTRGSGFIVTVEELREIAPAAYAYHSARGHTKLWQGPILLKQEVLGYVSLALPQAEVPQAYSQETLGILAQQLVLGIQFNRLALESQQLAITREKEQAASDRAAELASTNAALRRGVERLTDSGDIESLLGAFLLEAVAMCNADAGTVFTLTGNGTELRCRAATENGALISGLSMVPWVQRYPEVSAKDPIGIFSTILSQELVEFPLDTESLAGWFPEKASFHKAGGHTYSWNVCIRVGDQPAGFMGLSFREKRSPAPIIRDMVRTFVQQISLALEVTSLATEARDAAILREREIAAQQRAEALASANRSLREAASLFSSSLSPDDVLASVLQQAMIVSRADTATLAARCDESDDFAFKIFLAREDNQIKDLSSLTKLRRFHAGGRRDEYFSNLLSGRPAHIAVTREVAQRCPASEHIFARAQDGLMWAFPFVARGQTTAYMALGFAPECLPDSLALETAEALACQASLILETLAAASREQALELAREQERAVLQERSRLSEEMHDGIQQVFTAIMLQLATTARLLDQPDADKVKALEIVQQTKQLAESGLLDVRQSVSQLRRVPQTSGTSLRAMLEELRRSVDSDRLACRLVSFGVDHCLPEDRANNVIRICQEAVSNACKHAQASQITIQIVGSPHTVEIEIVDNGVGFVVADAMSDSGSLGMRNMMERSARIGAQIRIDSVLGQGTTISLRLPLVFDETAA